MSNIHLKSAWSHLRRSPFQAIAATMVLVITFFVVTVLSILAYSSGKLITYFETRPQIIAFIKDDVDQARLDTLQNEFLGDSRIESVSFVSKEEALEIYKKATADNPVLSELVNPSIFPSSLEIRLKDLSYAEEVVSELENREEIDQVGYTASLGSKSALTDAINRLRSITYYVKIGGGVFAGLLTLTSLFILVVVISMRITTRRGEIEILRLIGATPGFIRNPFLLEALIYSTIGVFIGWFLAFSLVLYLTPSMLNYFGEIPILPGNVSELSVLFLTILGGELVIGYVLSLMGSFMAISRASKKRV